MRTTSRTRHPPRIHLESMEIMECLEATRSTEVMLHNAQHEKVHKKHPDRTLMELRQAVSVIKQVIDQDKDNVLSEYRIDPIQRK